MFGNVYPFKSWRAALLHVCEALALKQEDFAAITATLRGRTRQYIAASPQGMINPLPINGTTLWLEANQNQDSIIRLIKRLLTAFGYREDEFGS